MTHPHDFLTQLRDYIISLLKMQTGQAFSLVVMVLGSISASVSPPSGRCRPLETMVVMVSFMCF